MKIRYILPIAFIMLLTLTSCSDIDAPETTSASESKEISIQQTESEEDKTVLSEEETRQYELIKEQLPQLLGSLGLSECTISTPVYTINYGTGEKSETPLFYVISKGELVSAVYAIGNEVGLTEPVAKGLNELFVNHTAFAWISGFTGTFDENDMGSQGFPVSGYIYDGEWHQNPDNYFKTEITNIDGYELGCIEDMGETVYAES